MRMPLAILLTLALTGSFLLADPPEKEKEKDDVPDSLHHKMNHYGAGAVTKGATGVVTPPITYHGGALMSTPVVYIVWYGNWNQSNGSDTPAGQQIVRDFLNNIGGSPYFAINTTYSTNGYTITGNVLFGGEATDTGSLGTRLSDNSVLTIVNNAISQRKLPYDANGIYFVLTSSNVTETSGFCTKYCGWHTSATPSVGKVRFSFVGNAFRCINSCAAQTVSPNGNPGVDGMISVIAHELEEATADPDPNSGWVDSANAENADKCAWTFGQNLTTLPSGAVYNMTLGSRNYLIQRNLKHAASGDSCNISLIAQ